MLKFKNGKFTIMQVTDAQDLHFVRHSMIKMLGNAYDKVKPDLIVLTGDNILGNHLCDARFGSKIVVHDKAGEEKNMRKAIDKLVCQIEKRGIPFAFIYGNHDDMNRLTKSEQAEIYKEYSTCVNPDTENFSYCLPIYSDDGNIKFNLFMLDTARANEPQGVRPKDIEKISNFASACREKYGKTIPAITFMHIPPEEELQLIEESDTGVRGDDGKLYKLKNASGEFNEFPSVAPAPGLFEIAENTGIKAVVCGHDHQNGFHGKVNGVEIMQTPCASFRCYGTRQRGVRVFDINENGGFDTYLLDMEELLGKGIGTELRYFWDADENEGKKTVAMVATAVTTALSVSATLVTKEIRRKK